METQGGNGRLDQDLVDICFGIGLSVKTTAWVVRDSVDRVWHEWSVRTGLPTPHDPISSVIEQRAKEVQAGWTEEQRQLVLQIVKLLLAPEPNPGADVAAVCASECPALFAPICAHSASLWPMRSVARSA
jgi:hypothetical protein